jgi:riboflavin synthase
MFSGIVEGVGRIVSVARAQAGVRIGIDCAPLSIDDVAIGDSVAVSGCCLTVVHKDRSRLDFDVSAETIACTANLDRERPVNLEKALRLGDRLGGHLMTGHVDGVGSVTRFEELGESWLLEVEVPRALRRYLARKGSICVDGVSLTVNAVEGARFSVNLIPHTLAVTTLSRLAPGERVNLEMDLVARYLESLTAARLDEDE